MRHGCQILTAIAHFLGEEFNNVVSRNCSIAVHARTSSIDVRKMTARSCRTVQANGQILREIVVVFWA
jgi:hypothetical protein